nr:NB-ARC domain-containing protein [Streptomyces sp. GMY02]
MVTAVVSAVTSLAENAATGQDRWPGPLDAIRQHAWIVLGAGLAVALLLALYALRGGGDPPEIAGDPPPPVPPRIPRWVVDRAQAAQVAGELCRRRGRRSVGITSTAALHGAGGFGKTTLADMVWADRRVQRRFNGRIYRVTLGLDVRRRAEIATKVAEATRFITGDTTVFDDPDLAGAHLGRLLDARAETLLILDDVWTPEQLAPFLTGGANCRTLITTRLPELLPASTHQVRVDQMSTAQARQVLTFDLPGKLPEATVRGLLRATGRWPLLLRIANRHIHRRMMTGVTAADAGAAILERLRTRGPAGLDPGTPVDLKDPQARQTAVRAAVEAGAELLPMDAFDRFTELGVFVEDESIPVGLIAALWQATSSLDQEQSRELCAALGGLSLLALDPAAGGRVRLHDVIRGFLRSGLDEERLREVNRALVDAAASDVPPAGPQPGGGGGPARAWWQHPDRYVADHFITHLLDAGHAREAEALALDLRWIEQRLDHSGASAPPGRSRTRPHPGGPSGGHRPRAGVAPARTDHPCPRPQGDPPQPPGRIRCLAWSGGRLALRPPRALQLVATARSAAPCTDPRPDRPRRRRKGGGGLPRWHLARHGLRRRLGGNLGYGHLAPDHHPHRPHPRGGRTGHRARRRLDRHRRQP